MSIAFRSSNQPPFGEIPQKGKIITFYSYKGGTGRSMALANVAWVLASSGKKVLVIDWDLEAPGLFRYFYPFLLDKDLSFSDGVINFVDNFRSKALTPLQEGEEPSKDWFVPYADLSKYAVALERDFPSGGKIDLVPAGRQDSTYSSLVSEFNWEDFYVRLGGSKFIDAACDLLRGKYHYILIDSRTGVSDTSGICTVKMPDALVVCFTLNYQSINGGAAVADYVYDRRVKSSDNPAPNIAGDGRSKFNIFPVPMRLDDAQKRKMERRREYARLKKFSRYPIYLHSGTREEYWANIPIWYSSFYAYEEILAAFGEKERDITSLLSSVERLTSYLTDGIVNAPLTLPAKDREEILKEFEGETYEPVAVEAQPRHDIENLFATLNPEQQRLAQTVILRLIRVAGPNETEHTGQIVPMNEFDAQTQDMIHALQKFQLLQVTPDSETKQDMVRISPAISLREWAALNLWIESDRDFLIWRQTTLENAYRWNKIQQSSRGQSSDYAAEELLRGSVLPRARMYYNTRRNELPLVLQSFIEASLSQERPPMPGAPVQGISVSQIEPAAQTSEQRRPNAFENLVNRIRKTTKPPDETETDGPNVAAAKEILRGKKLPPSEILKLAKKLKAENCFTYARRILARARKDSGIAVDKQLQLEIYQQSALCTYKDSDLAIDERLKLALDILRQVEDFKQTQNQETLGLVGAIYKRKWEVDRQKQNLELSLEYYRRGYQQNPINDQGYTAINTAFVLDLLAREEAQQTAGAGVSSDLASQRHAEARRIREHIVRDVAPLLHKPGYEWLNNMWWFYSTIAEAQFGLQKYEEAVDLLMQGREAAGKIPDWEYESTIRQLARLAMIQSENGSTSEFEDSPAWKALTRFFGNNATPVRSAFLGKFGLALSGGGFRASLYHIGILAKLAEMDILRHVEVLSCVSGGAIVGAHYYLEVRQLLRTKKDVEITKEDYIEIVQRMQHDFLAGVQRNIRTRIASEFLTNALMIFNKYYSRTKRAGELYEREIFSRVKDGEGDRARWLDTLKIHPLDGLDSFNPKNDNWRRSAKVPILILNATTLNTGHNWQFTAAWMGEPPAAIVSDIDGNDLLRRMYYYEAPEAHRHIRLGHAVAASACVPGLFEPLVLNDLYPDRSIRLVDGGVCDNQGVSSLLEQDCTVLLVSDGSGQMESQNHPSSSLLGVPLRSNSILQARIRDAQYRDLAARRRSYLLRGLMFVHLKQDLDVDPVDWVDCLEPFDASDEARPAERKGLLTKYGIAKDIQLQLSAIRTDLDSFSDAEAFALMTSGYRMVETEFATSRCIDGSSFTTAEAPWEFLAIEPCMKGSGEKYRYLKQLLGASSSLAFKAWKLSPLLRFSSRLLGVFLVLYAAFLIWKYSYLEIIPSVEMGQIGMFILSLLLTLLGTYFFGKTIMRTINWRDSFKRAFVGIVMCFAGWIFARLHLLVFDEIFLNYGSLQKLLRIRK